MQTDLFTNEEYTLFLHNAVDRHAERYLSGEIMFDEFNKSIGVLAVEIPLIQRAIISAVSEYGYIDIARSMLAKVLNEQLSGR